MADRDASVSYWQGLLSPLSVPRRRDMQQGTTTQRLLNIFLILVLKS